MNIREAALAYVDAVEAVRDARNGQGHPSEAHDKFLHQSIPGAEVETWDLVGDCSACGGAQYGAETDENLAMGDMREALGLERRPWEI